MVVEKREGEGENREREREVEGISRHAGSFFQRICPPVYTRTLVEGESRNFAVETRGTKAAR